MNALVASLPGPKTQWIGMLVAQCRVQANHSHLCMTSPIQSPFDGGRSAQHLADDSLTYDEASLQSGVGCGGDTGGGAMHLDSNSGYVCTLDFPNLTVLRFVPLVV